MAESKLPYAPRVNRLNTYQVTYGQCGARQYQATNYTWSSRELNAELACEASQATS